MSDDGERWREKYAGALENLEQHEKRLGEIEALMRHAVARLCLIAQGGDGELDRRLRALREAARRGDNIDRLRPLLDDVSRAARGEESGSGMRDGYDGILPALRELLDTLPWPDTHASRAAQLHTRVGQRDVAAQVLARELAELIAEALESARGGAAARLEPRAGAAPGDSAGMLEFLLQEIPVPAARRTEWQELRSQFSAAREQGELRQLASRLAHLVSTAATVPAGSVIDSQQIAPVLIGLLNELVVPADLAERVAAIRDELHSGVPTGRWPDVLASIAGLVTAMRRRVESERADLENFLLQLTNRLQDLDQHLHGVAAHQEAARSGSQRLDDAVHAEMRVIEADVHQAGDLDQLKNSVRQRVETLRAHLDEHRRQQAQRQAQLDEKLNHMTSRLRAVEQESTHLRAHLRRRRVEAMKDPLTGINNRLAFEDRLAREYARWKRYRRPLTLLILDVDHFKQINDGYGHKAGDRALKLIAQLLSQNLREADFLGRYGGEEFVALLPDTPHENVQAVSEKLRAAIENSDFHHHERRVRITLSIGYAYFQGEDAPEDVFQRADKALYRAKAEGRNRCAGPLVPPAGM
jgi:diguanylate cyclase